MCEGQQFEVVFSALVGGVMTPYAAGSRAEVAEARHEAWQIDADLGAQEGLSEGYRYFYTMLGKAAGIDLEVTALVLDGFDIDIRARQGVQRAQFNFRA